MELEKNLPEEIRSASGQVVVAQSRAIQEVQAAFVMAKKFPRDQNAAFARIIESCKRYSLAAVSMYRYPRGKETVSGPSIRLAEVLVQNWANLSVGWREVERRANSTICEAFCLDYETNTQQTITFEVPHEIMRKTGEKKRLVDPRDIYEIAANMAARRRRACILGIIPKDIVDAAVEECKKTLAKGSGEPISDRIKKLVVAFNEFSVSQEMLEMRLGHSIDLTSQEEIVELIGIYTSLRDKHGKRSDFFEFPEDEEKDSVASKLQEKLKTKNELK